MKKAKLLLLFNLNFIIFSCGSDSGKNKNEFSLSFVSSKAEFKLGEEVKLRVQNPKDKKIDSTSFYYDDNLLGTSVQSPELNFTLKSEKLGNQKIDAIVFSEGEQDSIQIDVKIFNDKAPDIYTYTIVNEYPHDIDAYTQGLEFFQDTLYESTGQYGTSSLRKTNFETGEVLKKVELGDEYFGEGLSILNNNIYQLSWKAGEGFIYSLDKLEKIGSFKFNNSKEGWGLTNNGAQFYKSDGTEKIWILNGTTLAEESYIQPTTDRSISTQLNELEWVNGKIYANTYQKDGVAIINPKNGAIEGIINFHGLRDKVSKHPGLDVLNGIAYNPNTNKLYVTGKNWDKLFEIEIVKK